MIKVVYIREKGWYNIKMQIKKFREIRANAQAIMADPMLQGQAKEAALAILKIGGMIVFLALTFMFYFMVAWFAIILGFMQANKRGSKQ